MPVTHIIIHIQTRLHPKPVLSAFAPPGQEMDWACSTVLGSCSVHWHHWCGICTRFQSSLTRSCSLNCLIHSSIEGLIHSSIEVSFRASCGSWELGNSPDLSWVDSVKGPSQALVSLCLYCLVLCEYASSYLYMVV